MMGWFDRWFGVRDTDRATTLYNAIVARAREPHWYLSGDVADTIDGRFDMVAAVLSMVLLRMETEPAAAEPSAALAEVFVADMDGQMRQIGIGDVTVGKHVGRMMGMLGGRLGAYRDGLAAGSIREAIVRNIYRGAAPAPRSLAHVEDGLMRLRSDLDSIDLDALLAGQVP